MKEKQNPIMKRNYLYNVANTYREHFTTVAEWDEFAKPLNLPTASAYRYAFGSWNEAKEYVGLKKEREINKVKYHYTIKELEGIAETHGRHMTTLAEWDEYAKKNNLPVGMTFIQKFGTDDKLAKWEDIKKKYHVVDPNEPKVTKGKFGEYTDESLIEIAKNNFSNFNTRKNWDDFVESNKDKMTLPPSYLYIKHFSTWNEAKKRAGGPDKQQQLEDIMVAHKEHFQLAGSSRKWDEYASLNNLPKASSFVYVFGSWNKAKEHAVNLYSNQNIKKR